MIKSSTKTFYEFLRNDYIQYSVPSFQRPYSWDIDYWEKLLNDLIELEEEKNSNSIYFLGLITTKTVEIMHASLYQNKLLIDGQQRIATVSILLSALRDLIQPRETLKNKLNRLLLSSDIVGNELPKLILTEKDQASFLEILQQKSLSKTKIKEAYDYFFNTIKEIENDRIEKYLDLIRFVAQNIYLIEMEIDTYEEAYSILKNTNYQPPDNARKPYNKIIKVNDLNEKTFIEKQLDYYRKYSNSAEIMSLIASGESARVEFKIGLLINPFTNSLDPKMKEKVIRAVAAFMNSEIGGTVVIGVADNGTIKGINTEYQTANPKKGNWDGYSLFLSDLLDNNLDVEVPSRLYTISRYTIDEKDVCIVEVKPSSSPVYVDKQFFIKSQNRTMDLKGPDLVKYVTSRWPVSGNS